jgi:hypothetical protein
MPCPNYSSLFHRFVLPPARNESRVPETREGRKIRLQGFAGKQIRALCACYSSVRGDTASVNRLSESIMQDPRTLDYSQHGRRPARRWIIAGAMGCALALVLIPWREPVVRRWRILQLQARVLRFLDAPGTVVYEEDPTESAKLLASGKYQRIPYAGTFAGTDWDPVTRIAPDQTMSTALVFQHGLRCKGLPERLVVIEYRGVNEEELGHGRVVRVTSFVQEKAGFWPGSRGKQLATGDFDIAQGLNSGDRVRFYGGQLDASDASRFTIRYQINQEEGMLEGKLRSDDTVELKLISPSSATRLPVPTASPDASSP